MSHPHKRLLKLLRDPEYWSTGVMIEKSALAEAADIIEKAGHRTADRAEVERALRRLAGIAAVEGAGPSVEEGIKTALAVIFGTADVPAPVDTARGTAEER